MAPRRNRYTPIGEHHTRLSSWLGYCAKRFGPPRVPWIEVQNKYRSQLLTMVQDYFEVSMESPPKWKKLEEEGKVVPDSPEEKRAKFEHFYFSQMSISYCKWKSRLYKKYKPYSSDEERLKHVPDDLNVDTWKEMFKVFSSKEFQMDEETGEVPKSSEVWMATHGYFDEHGDNEFRDSKSREIYEEMRRIETQPTHVDEPVLSPDEVFLKVSGVKSGYVHGT